MPLSDTAIRNAKPGLTPKGVRTDKPYKMTDAGGLYLLVRLDGARWWRLDYRRPIIGKRNTLSLGTYPDTPLKEARDKRESARKLLAADIDPGEHRRATQAAGEERAANSFEVVAREWFAKQSATWADSHSSKILLRLESYLFPWLGARPIAEITAKELLTCIRRVENRGAVESAHRTLQNCGQIFRYAIATGRAESNPAGDLRGSLAPTKETHHAAITDPQAIGGLLRASDDYRGSFVTKCALQLAPLLFVRPGELRTMEWAELDLDGSQWNIPAEKMKMDSPHLVPLSSQSVAILREIEPLTGRGRYVFPSARSPKRPMSNNAVLSALRRMGYAKEEMSGHGFRAMARTVLDEVLNVRPDFIEHQLAHAVRDPNGRAYNRTAHLAERKAMMQQWADYRSTRVVGKDGLSMPNHAQPSTHRAANPGSRPGAYQSNKQCPGIAGHGRPQAASWGNQGRQTKSGACSCALRMENRISSTIMVMSHRFIPICVLLSMSLTGPIRKKIASPVLSRALGASLHAPVRLRPQIILAVSTGAGMKASKCERTISPLVPRAIGSRL